MIDRAEPLLTAATHAAPAPPIRVLLVEDEPTVRTVAMRVLQRRGFAVFAAGCAEDALALLSASGGVDVVVTDMCMPGMSGLELARRIAERTDAPRVMLMSGFASGGVDPDDLRRVAQRFLLKPFTPDQLADAVQDLAQAA